MCFLLISCRSMWGRLFVDVSRHSYRSTSGKPTDPCDLFVSSTGAALVITVERRQGQRWHSRNSDEVVACRQPLFRAPSPM